ncbi:hypothetical protein EXVG_00431 [Emiliania huxleyi virus 202]|nr:hypothetical protein EXVG_00431 [Emiliania huxleyi virus 202]AHA54318.1 hypothetical protein EhV18_00272 [Emiliania huxleyi virus 18]AHA55365.1 hypothetical protein EhV156_00270 [Emiliania huxleyi virus 156]
MTFSSDWVNDATLDQISDTFYSFQPGQSQINKYNTLINKHAGLNFEYAAAQNTNQLGIIANASRKRIANANKIAALLNGTRGKQNGNATAARKEESTSRYVAGDKRARSLVENNPDRKRQAVNELTEKINYYEQRNRALSEGRLIPTADGFPPELLDNDIQTWHRVNEKRSRQYQGLDPAYQTGDLNNPFTDYDKRRRLQKMGMVERDDGSFINEFPWVDDNRPPRTDADIRAKLPPDATHDEIDQFKSMKDSELYVEYGWPPRRDEVKRRPLAQAAFERALERHRIAREESMRTPGIVSQTPWVPSVRQPVYVPSQKHMNLEYPVETYMPNVSLDELRASQRVDALIRTENEKLFRMKDMLSDLNSTN